MNTTFHSCSNPAPDGPGCAPTWTRGDKDAVGTAYSTASPIWFTVSRGLVNEVYYPTIDRPQIRDLQYLITDGESFFHDERRDTISRIEGLSDYCLGVRVRNEDPAGRYSLEKQIIAHPYEPGLLIHTRLEGDPEWLDRLQIYLLCAPHLEVGGWGNTGEVAREGSERILLAHKGNTWMALGATVPFARASCGFVGVNDGWTDLHDNFQMDWEYDCAIDGNIALTAQLALEGRREWTVALTFGQGEHHVETSLFQSLAIPFAVHRAAFLRQWELAADDRPAESMRTGDGGALYWRSHALLLGHEDKRYPGALVASLSIPWGQAKGDEEGDGGYHLVWTRDLVQSALGLLATGNTATPLRGLIYLAAAQNKDGGFHQNFWVNGEPYWTGVQLDEVAFPILLAWRLHRMAALLHFDPYPMMLRAAAYLIRRGPATPQERWEEASGYSPATLASNVAALVCTGAMARARGDEATARFVESYADFLESHIEQWTVTTEGTLHPEIARHYIRITPADAAGPSPHEDPNQGMLTIANRPPNSPYRFPAKEIVDPSFLELVRHGVRPGDDPLIADSIRVIDHLLRMETPKGPAWRRYNHDGYGQRADGGPFVGWGTGRAWPLLTGERGHYELAAGRDPMPYIRAMERFAHCIGLLTEQVWDEADRPAQRLFCGQPTGAAMPLMWAHSEYIRLVRSAADGVVWDRIPEVVERYSGPRWGPALEVWKPNRQPRVVPAGYTLRVQLPAPFRLHWSLDGWGSSTRRPASDTPLGISYLDIALESEQRAPLRFIIEGEGSLPVARGEYIVEVERAETG